MTNANTIILRFIFTGLVIFPFLLFGQEKKRWYKGFGIEEGVGYNTATWKYTNLSPPGMPHYNFTESKYAFGIQPTVRIFYSCVLHSFTDSLHKKLKVLLFTSYYNFGGKGIYSGGCVDDPNAYCPTTLIYLFRSIEAGINPYIEKNKFQFGLLFKGQYIFSANEKMYMISIINPPFWKETDISKDYKTFAMNTGIKLKYKIIKGFFIAGETWFGITNLYVHSTYGGDKLRVTENNYRLLIGYEL